VQNVTCEQCRPENVQCEVKRGKRHVLTQAECAGAGKRGKIRNVQRCRGETSAVQKPSRRNEWVVVKEKKSAGAKEECAV